MMPEPMFSAVDHDPFAPQLTPIDHDPFAIDARANALNAARLVAPGLTDYLTKASPPPSFAPNVAGKIPEIGYHPSATGAGNDIVNLLTSFAPGGAAKGAMLAGMAGGARRMASVAERVVTPAAEEAARLARAAEGKFYMNMPLGHGTAPIEPFTAFDSARGGATLSSAPAAQGVFAEVRPKAGGIADEFAGMAAQRTGGNPQVMPLVHRSDRPGVIHLQGDEQNHEIAATLADAWARGHDAIMLKNYTTPGGKSGDILVVKDPAQLRSPYAQFDPAQRHSRELLAGLAGVGATGAAYHLLPVDHDPFAEQASPAVAPQSYPPPF